MDLIRAESPGPSEVGPRSARIPSDMEGFYRSIGRKPVAEQFREKRPLLQAGRFLDRLAREIRAVTGGRRLGTVVDFGGDTGATLALLGERLEIDRKICYDLIPPAEPLPGVEYIHGTWEDLSRTVGDGSTDLVLAEEVIEHVFSPDALLQRCQRLLKSGGILVITTPNLSSAVNRVGLLLGRQPAGTEVSTLATFTGKGSRPGPVAGHIRVFTFGALLEFLEFHGFSIARAYTEAWPPRRARGETAPASGRHRFNVFLEGMAVRLGRSLASRTVVIARAQPIPSG